MTIIADMESARELLDADLKTAQANLRNREAELYGLALLCVSQQLALERVRLPVPSVANARLSYPQPVTRVPV